MKNTNPESQHSENPYTGSVGSNQDKPYSKFQSIILKVFREKLNLMLMEVCQLKGEVDFTNQKKLTCTVLEKIVNSEIISVHVTKEEAEKFLTAFQDCRETKKVNTQSFKTKNKSVEDTTDNNNPFYDSPFA